MKRINQEELARIHKRIDAETWPEKWDSTEHPHETLPTMYDLPSENPEEPGLPDEFHYLQPQLLSTTLSLTNYSAMEPEFR